MRVRNILVVLCLAIAIPAQAQRIGVGGGNSTLDSTDAGNVLRFTHSVQMSCAPSITAGPAALASFESSGGAVTTFQAWAFDAATAEALHCAAWLPAQVEGAEGLTVTVQGTGLVSTATCGGTEEIAAIEVSYKSVPPDSDGADEPGDAAWTTEIGICANATADVDCSGGSHDIFELRNISCVFAGNPAANRFFMVRVRRMAADGADTFDNDFGIVDSVTLSYKYQD